MTRRRRVAAHVPARIVTRDDIVLTAVDPADRVRCALVGAGRAGRGWRDAAEVVWAAARPWSPAIARRETDRRQAVLALLHEGRDDEAIARRLGVSVRTVRREVADLMVEHGAQSRFQLGVALAQVLS